MAEDRIRLYRAIPGPSSIGPLLANFSGKGTGIVSSFHDAMLPFLRELLGEDSECQVESFGVLVRRSLEDAGEEGRFIASGAQYHAAIGQAARRLPPESSLRNAVRFPGLQKRLGETLAELSEWHVAPSDLRLVAEGLDPAKGSKLHDLARLSEDTDELLQLIGRDTHQRQLSTSRDAMLEPDGRQMRYLIFVGEEASPARLDWVRWVADQGADVTMVLERHASGGALFRQVDWVSAYLETIPVDIGAGNRLLNNLFVAETLGSPDLSVQISSAADPLAECEWALRSVGALYPAESCAIFVRDLESYAPLLEASSARLQVPVKIQRRMPLVENAFVRMTLGVLEACAGNDVRRFQRLVLTSYIDLKAQQRLRLTGAVEDAHSRRDLQWATLRGWIVEQKDEFEWLGLVLDWRERVTSSQCSIAEWSQRLRELVHELPWHQGLSAEGYYGERDGRAFHAMQSSLANEALLEAASGKVDLSLERFVVRCRAVWESADVSVPSHEGVPVVSDSVAVGAANHVFVLGMLEGVFPRRRSEDPILSDEERALISDCLKLSQPLPTSYALASAERDAFYRVCASARDSLTLSYPLADDQRDNIPAFYLDFVKQALPSKETGNSEVVESSHPRSELAPVDSAVSCDADLRMRAALQSPREQPQPSSLETSQAANLLKKGETFSVSPRELSEALQCPFRFQTRRTLKLETPRRAAAWSRLYELPRAANLASAPSALHAQQALQGALEVVLDRLIVRTEPWEQQIVATGGQRLIDEWISREFLARSLWPKDENSTRTHVGFGTAGLKSEMPGGVSLSGFVPAISTIDGNTTVLHLYDRAPVHPPELTDSEQLYFGLHFLAAFESKRELAIEVDDIDGTRSLLLLTRAGVRPLHSKQPVLHVIDLSQSDEPLVAKKLFFKEVRRLLDLASNRVRNGEIVPLPGEHCEWCDCGELCRRSSVFSDEDSPFGPDAELELV